MDKYHFTVAAGGVGACLSYLYTVVKASGSKPGGQASSKGRKFSLGGSEMIN